MNGLRLLCDGFDELDQDWFAAFNIAVLMSEALGRAGQIDDGLAAVEKSIARCERTEGRWLISELLRIKGELLLLQGTAGTTEAVEDVFRQALDWARRQGALSWELRAATSLARLLRDRDRIDEARDLLAPIYERFTEGFGTADLQAAKQLLNELSDVPGLSGLRRADLAASAAESAISFGPYRLLPTQRLLMEGDKPVRLGSRALDILTALVEHRGEVVSRDELMARVWPNTHVEEGNLKFQISALRRTLGGGNRYLVNIPGRGYSFVAPVARAEEARIAAPEPPQTQNAHNLPALLTRLIGREDTITRLANQLLRQRLLTIVGAGGIGKTSVALAVAEQLMPAYEHGVWLIDLAPLADPRLVPSALADALGLEIRAENPLPGLVASFRDKKMLLVLDNCEHVIDAAATLAVGVLAGAPGVQVLATSREPLRIEGEHVHRLSPLASPPALARLTAAEALGFPAVQLFVERAAATLDEFELTDADAPIVADICGRLDGIALAIELAAARVDTFGVRGVAAHLDDRFQLLTRGRRTALPRHRTLRATLDWSYELLPEPERVVLRRLAIFAGGFTEEAARAVAASAEIAASEVVESLANLVTKSLVSVDVGGVMVRYRPPETIRAYALQRLIESGEREQIARRHAEYHLGLFERAEAEAETRPMAEWLAEYRPRIDNLRAALDWAFSPGGNAAIGVALTAASVPLWVDLSMMAECRRHVERAIARLDLVSELDPRQEMHLQAALGVSLNYTTGPIPETEAAWTRTLEIAKSLDDTEFQLRALRGLWAHHMNAGEYRASLALADEFSALAETTGDPAALGAADRMAGIILHYLGDQTGARQHLERRLARAVSTVRQSQPVRFLIDQRVAARALLARILWLQGFPDQASSTARLAVDEAEATGHALSLCHALAQAACPVATAQWRCGCGAELYRGPARPRQRTRALRLDRARPLLSGRSADHAARFCRRFAAAARRA